MNRLLERLNQVLRSGLGTFLLVATFIFLSLSGGALVAMLLAGRAGLAWLLLAGAIAWLALTWFVVSGGGNGGPPDDLE